MADESKQNQKKVFAFVPKLALKGRGSSPGIGFDGEKVGKESGEEREEQRQRENEKKLVPNWNKISSQRSQNECEQKVGNLVSPNYYSCVKIFGAIFVCASAS